MENNKIRILIVEDNLESANAIKNDLKTNDNFEVIALCTNMEEALYLIKSNKPDLLITDLVLKGKDGFELLEEIKNRELDIKIIVLSALSHQGFIQKAMMLGASYYMVKPYNKDVLIKRVFDVFNEEPQDSVLQDKKKVKNLEEKITNIFITVGIPAHIKGYQFLREAIKMAIENPEIINSITKKLYPSIAQKFETSSSKVERAIRHAIEVAWNKGKIENINTLFGVKVYSNNEKPTNGEFIALVADKMLLEGV